MERHDAMSPVQVGVCPVCGGKLIEDPHGDRIYCDTCDYDTSDPETWGQGQKEETT